MNKRERVQEMLLEWREVFFKNLKQRFDKKETTDKIYHDLLYRDVPHAERQADMSVDPSLLKQIHHMQLQDVLSIIGLTTTLTVIILMSSSIII